MDTKENKKLLSVIDNPTQNWDLQIANKEDYPFYLTAHKISNQKINLIMIL